MSKEDTIVIVCFMRMRLEEIAFDNCYWFNFFITTTAVPSKFVE